MKIIGAINQKGGAGKSTLLIHLSKALSKFGTVAIVDLDPQPGVDVWSNQGGAHHASVYKLADNAPEQIRKEILFLAGRNDFVLVDTPGTLSGITEDVARIAQLLIIPVLASPLDMWSTEDVADVVNVVQASKNKALKYRFIINRDEPSTMTSKKLKAALSEVPRFDFEILKRTIYADSLWGGGTVFDSSNRAAQMEIRLLASEIMGLLN